MNLQRTGQVMPNLVHGIERGEGILEDHLHLRGERSRACCGDNLAVEEHFACVRLHDPREQTCDGCLPGSALAHDGRDRPRHELHRNVIHRVKSRATCQERRIPLDPVRLRQTAALEHGRLRSDVRNNGNGVHTARSPLVSMTGVVRGRATAGSGSINSGGAVDVPRWSQHATSRDDPASGSSFGTSWRHCGIAHVQRGWNAHPGGRSRRSGGEPGIPSIR